MDKRMDPSNGYKELRGAVEKKRKGLFGKRFFVISGTRVEVGKAIWDKVSPGTELTVGHIKGKMINFRRGICLGEGSADTRDTDT